MRRRTDIAGAAVSTVVGDDDEPLREAIDRAVTSAGGRVVARATTGHLLVPLVDRLRPRLVVLDLSVSGSLGLDILPALHRVAPAATVALFDPLGVVRSIDPARVRVIDKHDLRQLRDLVTELRTTPASSGVPGRTPRPTS